MCDALSRMCTPRRGFCAYCTTGTKLHPTDQLQSGRNRSWVVSVPVQGGPGLAGRAELFPLEQGQTDLNMTESKLRWQGEQRNHRLGRGSE